MTRLIRIALASMALAIALPMAAHAQSAPVGYYPDQKVVYHNDGGGPDIRAYFGKLLGNLKNHVEAVGKDHVQIRVVSNSDGMVLFQMAQSDKGLARQIDALKSQGAQFLICQNTLHERKLDWHALYGVQEVSGSIPLGSTNLSNGLRLERFSAGFGPKSCGLTADSILKFSPGKQLPRGRKNARQHQGTCRLLEKTVLARRELPVV